MNQIHNGWINVFEARGRSRILKRASHNVHFYMHATLGERGGKVAKRTLFVHIILDLLRKFALQGLCKASVIVSKEGGRTHRYSECSAQAS